MIISESTVAFSGKHAQIKQRDFHESLQFWIGSNRPNATSQTAPPDSRQDNIILSVAAEQVATKLQETTMMTQAPTLDNIAEYKLQMIRELLEKMTGTKIHVISRAELEEAQHKINAQSEQAYYQVQAARQAQTTQAASTASAGYGLIYDYHESYHEMEQTSFQSTGQIVTEDGKTINFAVNLELTREYYTESNINVRLGDAKAIDPLVINFHGTAAQLTDEAFLFDLDADGKKERLHQLAPNSGFLVLDKNYDGKINDGQELFGPSTGSGFQELAQYDDDKNGWIDEADRIYKDLRLWSGSVEDDTALHTLKDKNIGAIYLDGYATPFDLKNKTNELQGQITHTSVYLTEDGTAGTIQELDLVAHKAATEISTPGGYEAMEPRTAPVPASIDSISSEVA